MRIELSPEAIERLSLVVRDFFDEEFDREVSEFQARRLIELFKSHMGATVYNQAIQDARSYFQARLDDLDAEFYEPEPPAPGHSGE